MSNTVINTYLTFTATLLFPFYWLQKEKEMSYYGDLTGEQWDQISNLCTI